MSAQIIAFPVGAPRLAIINARLELSRQSPGMADLAASAERRAYIVGFMDATMKFRCEPVKPPPRRRQAKS